jgi:hypothetical protein
LCSSREGESTFITWWIYARFNEASIERPVTFSVNISAQQGSQLAKDLTDFVVYGAPFEAPLGTVSGVANLPGGFGGPFEGGSLAVGEGADGEPYELRAQLLSPSGTVLESIRLRMRRTVGPSGRGVRSRGNDDTKTLTLELRHEYGTENLNFTFRVDLNGIVGRHPEEVVSTLRFLDELHAPNRIRLVPPYGPTRGEAAQVAVDPSPYWHVARRVVDALAVIQKHTAVLLRIPDMTETEIEDANHWLYVVRLLSRETVETTWSDLTVTGSAITFDQLRDSSPQTLRLVKPLKIEWGGTEIDLGYEEVIMQSAGLEPNSRRPGDGEEYTLRIVPVGSKVVRCRYLGTTIDSNGQPIAS